jgi:modification methylase
VAAPPSKRSEPRVPFLSVIETGFVKPGEQLVDAHERFAATVRADGSLLHNHVVASIHKMGALLQGFPTCNGWTFWHVRRGGELISIDDYRNRLREQLAAAG